MRFVQGLTFLPLAVFSQTTKPENSLECLVRPLFSLLFSSLHFSVLADLL
jgi:hypothetical protein